MFTDEDSSNENHNKIRNDLIEFNQILGDIVEFSKTRVHLYNVFKSIHKKMNEGIPYEEILNSIFDSISNIFSFDRIGVALLENNNTVIRVNWIKSKTTEKWLKKNYSESLEGSVLFNVIETNTPLIINDFEAYLQTHPKAEAVKLILREGMKSGFTYPLRIDKKPIGAISFSSAKLNNFQNFHSELLSEISEGLAIIVEQELLKNSVSYLEFKENDFKSSLHDLNNSLSVVCGTIQMMGRMNKHRDSNIQRSVHVMKKNCDAMIKIAHSIVYGEHSSHGENSVGKMVNLREFISDLRLDAIMLGKDKDIAFDVIIGTQVMPSTYIDALKIKQILFNLISNAIKFSPRGKKVSLRMDFDPSKKRLFFTVEDEGPGIPKEEQSNLFKQFGKTSVKSTDGELSSGRGLANVKKLVESLNGQVFVESEVGKGSIFGFWIPID